MKIKMKRIFTFFGLACLLATAACAQKGKKGSTAELKNELDSVSYVLGMGLGKNVRQSEIEGIEIDKVMQGLQDALDSDSAIKITQEDGNEIIRAFMTRVQAEQSAKGLEKADTYMAELKKDSKYQSTESGMLYEVITMGTGAKPTTENTVRVNYEGKTTEGEVFDSSYERGQPAEFPLTRVIPGWTEILQLMPVGSTWLVTIPPGLAYGERGSPPTIKPNAVLIFKIELIDIVAQP